MNEEELILSQIPKSKAIGPRAKSISSVLTRVLQEKGYAAQQSSALLQDTWNQAVGSILSQQSRLGKVQRGVLQVFADNDIVRTELEFCKRTALKAIQQTLPEFKIRDIRISKG